MVLIETNVAKCHSNIFEIFLSFRKATFIKAFFGWLHAQKMKLSGILPEADIRLLDKSLTPLPGPSQHGSGYLVSWTSLDFMLHMHSSSWATEQGLLNLFEAGLLTHSYRKSLSGHTSSFSCWGSPYCSPSSIHYA